MIQKQVIYIDGIRFKVLEDGQVKNKDVYVAIGINLDGMKDVLITTVDRLKGFEDAIKAM